MNNMEHDEDDEQNWSDEDSYYDEDEEIEEEEEKPVTKKNENNIKANISGNQPDPYIFTGYNFNKNGCSECIYCGKYFSNDYKIDGTCSHCWGFCFSSNFDLEKCTFNGPQTLESVKNYLKKTLLHHPKTCSSVDCIYWKINKFNNDKKLNRELGEFLGIMEPLPENKNENINNKSNGYSFINKKRNVKINFKLSSVSI